VVAALATAATLVGTLVMVGLHMRGGQKAEPSSAPLGNHTQLTPSNSPRPIRTFVAPSPTSLNNESGQPFSGQSFEANGGRYMPVNWTQARPDPQLTESVTFQPQDHSCNGEAEALVPAPGFTVDGETGNHIQTSITFTLAVDASRYDVRSGDRATVQIKAPDGYVAAVTGKLTTSMATVSFPTDFTIDAVSHFTHGSYIAIWLISIPDGPNRKYAGAVMGTCGGFLL
jgi:hypothetical protein